MSNTKCPSYIDWVEKSGILPEIWRASEVRYIVGQEVYDFLYREKDKVTNSDSSGGSSVEAARHLALCMGDAGYWYNNEFLLISDLAGGKKAAQDGLIKKKGTYRPAGEPVGGWVVNGRFRQQAGAPLAFNRKKDNKGFGKEKLEPRRYHQPAGKPLQIFFPPVTIRVWKLIAEKAGLRMPDYPTVGIAGTALGFWHWVQVSGCPIIITEGEKKAAALISRGYAAIGLPGIYTGYRVSKKGDWVFQDNPKDDYQRAAERELHETIKPFDGGRRITIIFDYRAGDYFQSPEFKAADTLSQLFTNSEVYLGSLPGPEKGTDDFIAAGGDVDSLINNAKPIAKVRARQLWGLKRYHVAWPVNKEKLGSLPFPNTGIVGVSSPKSTGKTFSLNEVCLRAAREGRKVLLLTHRVILGRAICQTVELTWIEDRYESRDDKQEADLFGYGLCVDSLHPLSQAQFNPADWEGAIVIMDEVEQIIWHLLNSSTCQENRVSILNTFKELVNTVLDTDGLFILQDADLSDLSFDFLLGLKDGEKPQPWIVRNDYKPENPWHIRYYDTQHEKRVSTDDPSGLLKDAVNEVNRSGKIWIQTDSQKAKSQFSSTNLEKYFRAKCPGKRILRIDQTTVSNPEHPAFQCSKKLQGDNSMGANYDIVICSPTLATGVSIDLKSHFTVVVGVFQGSCSENEVRQALARVREPIPRWLWVRKRAVAVIGNGSSSYYSVAQSKEKDIRQNLQMLQKFGFDFELDFDPTAFKIWAKMAARINASAWDFREAVADGLKEEGHILESVNDSDLDVSDVIKVICQHSQVEEAVKVAEAKELTREEYEDLADKKSKRNKTEAERFAEEKYELRERYGVNVTPELRQLNQDKWYGKIQLHYYLTRNAEYLKMREWKHFERHLKLSTSNRKICPQDVKLLSLQIEAHKILGTLQFTDPNQEWTKESPAVLDFVRKVLYARRDIKDICGLTVSEKKAEKDPISVVQTFLKQLGLRLTGEQRRNGEKRERVYRFGGFASANVLRTSGTTLVEKVSEPDGLRSHVFTHWEVKDATNLGQWQEVMGAVTPQFEVVDSVTPQTATAEIEVVDSVTPQTVDKDIALPVTPQITQWTGWVWRWDKWHPARFLRWCENGTRYVVEYLERSGNVDWMFVDPKSFVWAEGGEP